MGILWGYVSGFRMILDLLKFFSFNMSMNPFILGIGCFFFSETNPTTHFGRRLAASSTPADHQTWPENPRWSFPASHDCRRVLPRSLGIIYLVELCCYFMHCIVSSLWVNQATRSKDGGSLGNSPKFSWELVMHDLR